MPFADFDPLVGTGSIAQVHRARLLDGREVAVKVRLEAVLRASDLLLSSRFHALVGAMPGAVPSIDVSRDERIDNLFG